MQIGFQVNHERFRVEGSWNYFFKSSLDFIDIDNK